MLYLSALVEIRLQGMEVTSGISWRLLQSNCKSMDNLQPTVNRVSTVKCLLSVGQTYALQCDNTGDSWWKSNYLIIENSVYCEYAKGMKLVDIRITGKDIFC